MQADPRIRAAILIFLLRRSTACAIRRRSCKTSPFPPTSPPDDDITIPGYRSGLIAIDGVPIHRAEEPCQLLTVFKGGAHSMFTDRLSPADGI